MRSVLWQLVVWLCVCRYFGQVRHRLLNGEQESAAAFWRVDRKVRDMESSTKKEWPQEPFSRVAGGTEGQAPCMFCRQALQPRRRRTKKFCSDLCRSRFHAARRQAEQVDLKQRLERAEARLRQLEQTPGETAFHFVV